MKWETVTSGIGHMVYALWNNGRKLLTLDFHSTNYARIECDGEKRAFMIRYEGFLKNKLVMRNEYGIRIGHVSSENNENFISLNDERLFYTITNEKEPRAIIYKESKEKPLAVCALNLGNDKSILPSANLSVTHQSLLLALCWYLFLPVAKENVLEFA